MLTGGGRFTRDIEEVRWFTKTYEDILVVEAWATHKYIITGNNEISEEDPSYHISWSVRTSDPMPPNRGNIVSKKNPAPCVIQHDYRDINWFLSVLGQPLYHYKTHDYLSEIEGLALKSLISYCTNNNISLTYDYKADQPWFSGDDAIIGRMVINGKEHFSPRWSKHSPEAMFDSMAVSYVAQEFPSYVPKDIVRHLV